jgi:uncharacterized membrane protein
LKLKLEIGNQLTVPRIVIVVIATFLLVLFQNLPNNVLPTITELWHAAVIAAIVALTLILQYEGTEPPITPFAGSE